MDRKKIKATTEEVRKRQPVFTKLQKTVLLKVLGIDPIPGVEEKERDNARLETDRTTEATKRGLNPSAYRTRTDTGFCLFQKEFRVRIAGLVVQLQAKGLRYVGCFWQEVKGKKRPVQTFQFSTEGNALPIPPEIQDLFGKYFAECSVWCNLRYERDGSGQFRLDTINLTGPYKPKKLARELTIVGNTYRLM